MRRLPRETRVIRTPLGPLSRDDVARDQTAPVDREELRALDITKALLTERAPRIEAAAWRHLQQAGNVKAAQPDLP
ncbi:MAG TPA: hypothetical protein VKD72_18385, partial [Gemmataceae bacterium]|nr:hypothetical protein [Gemmataceae bacterium]